MALLPLPSSVPSDDAPEVDRTLLRRPSGRFERLYRGLDDLLDRRRDLRPACSVGEQLVEGLRWSA